MQRISVFGLGYVGCVTAASLAASGYEVVGVELNKDKVRMINNSRSPIVEAGLDDLLARVVKEGRLHATTSCAEAVSGTDLAFICVGTPGDEHGQLHLDALIRVSGEIGQALRDDYRPYTVVVRSTVLPGTVMNKVTPALLSGGDDELRQRLKIAVNPEFMREGTALKDFARPPMTLVGCEDKATASQLRGIYEKVDAPFVQTRIKTAEAVKYVCNAFHALKICFANEVGDACAAFGADPQEVMDIFCKDTKLNISPAYLRPGFAFGGSCLPKDLKALLYAARHSDVSVPLLDAILPANEAQIRRAIDAVLAAGSKRVGVFGLSFKAGTDDLRESPMVKLVEALIGKGCDVRILDRNVALARLMGANRRYISEEIPHIAMLMCESTKALLDHAEVLVIGNDSDEAERVLERTRPDQVIVDLTRGAVRGGGKRAAAA